MRVENRMREIRTFPRERAFEIDRHIGQLRHSNSRTALLDEALKDQLDIGAGGGFVERHTDLAVVEPAEIHAAHLGCGENGFARDTDDVDPKGVEEWVVADLVAELFQTRSEQRGERMNALCDSSQSIRA